MHLVGFSVGGVIAQLVALADPGSVSALTLLSSTPIGPGYDIEPAWPRYEAVLRPAPGESFDERLAYVERLWAAMAGQGYPYVPAVTRPLLRRIVERGWSADRVRRQFVACLSATDLTPDLDELRVPALVVHGTDDPVLPWSHGELAARRIRGARMITVEGLGHQLEPSVLHPLTRDILDLDRR